MIPLNSIEDDDPSMRYRNLIELYDACSFALIAADPTSFEDTVNDEGWYVAMQEEMEEIHKNKTWELSSLPEGMKAVGLKWIFKSKFNHDGILLRKKARVVAKGYSQVEGIDFDEIFSSMSRMETIRLFLGV